MVHVHSGINRECLDATPHIGGVPMRYIHDSKHGLLGWEELGGGRC